MYDPNHAKKVRIGRFLCLVGSVLFNSIAFFLCYSTQFSFLFSFDTLLSLQTGLALEQHECYTFVSWLSVCRFIWNVNSMRRTQFDWCCSLIDVYQVDANQTQCGHTVWKKVWRSSFLFVVLSALLFGRCIAVDHIIEFFSSFFVKVNDLKLFYRMSSVFAVEKASWRNVKWNVSINRLSSNQIGSG